ncbi:MAG: hypothetical protein K2M99_02440 [Treponemataceae bacterium]|nr:hypothetical protein [Treponemataceae bacterium]
MVFDAAPQFPPLPPLPLLNVRRGASVHSLIPAAIWHSPPLPPFPPAPHFPEPVAVSPLGPFPPSSQMAGEGYTITISSLIVA